MAVQNLHTACKISALLVNILQRSSREAGFARGTKLVSAFAPILSDSTAHALTATICCCPITEKRNEVVYYDTYETMEAMLEKEGMAASMHMQREELLKLQQKARQLEARRGRVSAKKAYLRNKKVSGAYAYSLSNS